VLDNEELNPDILPPDTTIAGRYRIIRFIGGGGMGNVYLAQDSLLEEDRIAIKVLHPVFARDQDLIKRFFREVQLMHKVSHPNVVRTYDAGSDGRFTYFTMEYVSAMSLDRCDISGKIAYDKLEDLTLQTCAGLQAIHDAEIIHRDLKPGNILLQSDWSLKITDFGVARNSSSKITQHKEIVGSVNYMSPEILSGAELTAAVDFYSLGVILYELATGDLPFEADNAMGLMWMHVNEPPKPPSEIRSDIPKWLDNLIISLLEKDPSRRPNSAHQVIRFLKHGKAKTIKEALHSSKPSRIISLNDLAPSETALSAIKEPAVTTDQETLNTEQTQEPTSDKKSLRSACSAIIFSNFPTIEEMREQRRRARDRKRTSGIHNALDVDSPESTAETRSYNKREFEIQELRRLQRYMFTTIALVLLFSLGTLTYVLYIQFAPSFQLSGSQKSSSSSLWKQIFSPDYKQSRTQELPPIVIQPYRTEQTYNTYQNDKPFEGLTTVFSFLQSLAKEAPVKETKIASKRSFSTPYSHTSLGHESRFDSWYSKRFLNSSSAASTIKRKAQAPQTPQPYDSILPPQDSLPKAKSLNELRDSHPALRKLLTFTPGESDNNLLPRLNSSNFEEQQAIYMEKSTIRNSLRQIELQLSSLTVSAGKLDEIDLNEKLKEVQLITRSLEEQAKTARTQYNFWIEQQETRESKGLTLTAKTLSAIDQEIGLHHEEYQKQYANYLAKIEQDKASSSDQSKLEARDAAKKMKAARDKLEDSLLSCITRNLHAARQNALNLTYATEASREEETRLKEQLSIQSLPSEISEKEKETIRKQLSSRKELLSGRLSELDSKLSSADEQALKRLLTFSEAVDREL
jgi:serine/threonine-protein kinase